jgi:molecular chaperone GrpE
MRMSEHVTETAGQPLDDGEVVEAELVERKGPPDPHTLGLELPADPDAAIELLLTELQTSREEASSYLDDLRRVAADFDNYRKRATREGSMMLERATEKVVRGLMPVLDTFDAALTAEPKSESESESEQKLYSGMLNTREQLLNALKNEGLEVIPTIDTEFDPEIHEPVGAPGGNGALIVTQELRRGYRLNGKVLRAALVVLEASE